MAPKAAYHLGNLLADHGALPRARAAYQQAVASGHEEWGRAAAERLAGLGT